MASVLLISNGCSSKQKVVSQTIKDKTSLEWWNVAEEDLEVAIATKNGNVKGVT